MKTKILYDSVYGFIPLTPLMQQIVDTPEFQRIRMIKQLGVSHFVFPGASNTRFEHSIGVSYLARTMAAKLTDDTRLIELISIAGLVHDIGHGPYSHIFDDIAQELQLFNDPELNKHERRSIELFKQMVSKYTLPLTAEEVQFICDCIIVPDAYRNIWKYQIISAEIDVDRMDYLLRDSMNTGISIPTTIHRVMHVINHASINAKGNLVFHRRVASDIKDILDSRTYLHEHVYQHRVSNKIAEMVTHTFRQTFGERKLTLQQFIGLNDSILFDLYFKEGNQIVERILMRKFN